jgi:hypothetical protein
MEFRNARPYAHFHVKITGIATVKTFIESDKDGKVILKLIFLAGS